MTPLPDIHLKDIGREKEGILPAEAFSKILESLYKDIASSAVIDTLNTRLKFLGWSVDTVYCSPKFGPGIKIVCRGPSEDIGGQTEVTA